MINKISIKGAREHNLKNISLDIPRNKLTVITGLSGSGKSSLAFDTIYAEGHRRYVESLSAYARQFLNISGKPDVDRIDGLSPAISIEQKTTSKNHVQLLGLLQKFMIICVCYTLKLEHLIALSIIYLLKPKLLAKWWMLLWLGMKAQGCKF